MLIFANPIAGRGQGGGMVNRLGAHLRRQGWVVRVYLERADRLEAGVFRQPGARAAIVIGGDGTLRGVASRFYQVNAGAGAGDRLPIPPLLVIPLGTANLMGQHLGLQWDDEQLPQQVAETLRGGKTVKLDAAEANGGLFLLVAGVGLDALVVHELDRLRSGPIHLLDYALPAGLALAQYRFQPLTVSVDGQALCRETPALLFVGNIPEYGTGFPMLPLAKADDGRLDVCLLPCRSRRDLVRLLLLAANGEHIHAEGVFYLKARQISVESLLPVPVQVDGDPAGYTPLEVRLLPHRLEFMVQGSRRWAVGSGQ